MVKVKRNILFFLLGCIFTTIINVGATFFYNAKDIEFVSSIEGWNVTNVEEAINSLNTKIYQDGYDEGYLLGYNSGYTKGKNDAILNTTAQSSHVLNGVTYSSSYGFKLTGTMPNFGSTYNTGITLTSGDFRPVFVVNKSSSGDGRVWRLKNSDGVERLCIGIPYNGYYDTASTLCTSSY